MRAGGAVRILHLNPLALIDDEETLVNELVSRSDVSAARQRVKEKWVNEKEGETKERPLAPSPKGSCLMIGSPMNGSAGLGTVRNRWTRKNCIGACCYKSTKRQWEKKREKKMHISQLAINKRVSRKKAPRSRVRRPIRSPFLVSRSYTSVPADNSNLHIKVGR
ncbi:hypothetical protein OUZ56_007676 [Daphnia magna]|uniref:Uncharacterized protein n=1 Tax=Daphnia magna TaxID=35525 RepID=A0ABR0AAM8_9CRUS|nr:hypothetical protein OUZ56_007676 [Daphnia magna]